MNIKKDYQDETGVWHRALLPDDRADPKEGVPLNVPVENLYPHMPHDFVARLSAALFARGLVEPPDYFKPGAHEQVADALLDVVKYDALNIIALARNMRE